MSLLKRIQKLENSESGIEYYWAQSQNNFWDIDGNAKTFDISLLPLTNSRLIYYNDTTETRIVAKKDCAIFTSIVSGVDAGDFVYIYYNDGSDRELVSQYANASTQFSTSAVIKLRQGEYIFYRAGNSRSIKNAGIQIMVIPDKTLRIKGSRI